MLSLAKDDEATVQVDGWHEAVAATPETIRAAMLCQRGDKKSPTISLERSDRYVMEVHKFRERYALRVMNFDSDRIVRKAWWAAPQSYQGGPRMGWLETWRSKNSKTLSYEEAALAMLAFVEGTVADVSNKWVPEHK